MNRFLRLFGLIALGVFVLAIGTQLSAPSLGAYEVAVDPALVAALERDKEVPVLISLGPPPTPLEEVTVDELRLNAEARQHRVLGTLAPSEIAVTYEYSHVAALAGYINESALAKLKDSPDVVAIALDPLDRYHAGLAESVPLIHANDGGLQFLGIDGTGVTVAVLDSGIDTDHPDLMDNVVGEKCFLSSPPPPLTPRLCPDNPAHPNYAPAHPAEDDWDPYYHGTHLSGIITSNGLIAPRGVASNAGIFAYKILDANGSTEGADILAALNDIIANHLGDIDFISMSLGDRTAWPQGTCSPFESAITDALIQLRNNGILSFAMAGNEGDKSGINFPGCVPGVISVGAVYDANLGSPQFYLDHFMGPLCTDTTTAPDKVTCFSNSSGDLDVLAPGAAILSTSGDSDGIQLQSGTSQATPHAVGVAALLKDHFPWLTPSQIETRLKSAGTWIKDDFNDSNSSTFRWTQRIDARVALLPDTQDYDQDGCANIEEFGSNVGLGGQRNPLNLWDYFDTPPRDKMIRVTDILAVVGRYFAQGDPTIDPFSPPPPAPAYHPAFDRGGLVGPNIWNLAPANGQIGVADILAVQNQYFHDCIAAP